ncbi:MAG: SPFH domain-containing protein [Pseudomonadota bacterium]|nr:SPFH domain-containing protein [Pseudomonadota bacterium]
MRFLALLPPLLAGCWLAGCLPHDTGSTEVGVRTAKVALFGGAGVVKDIYPSGGTFFFAPFINDWHVYDIGLQNLAMTRDLKSGAREGDDSLHFKTHDGNDISVDVTVAWHIDPAKVVYVLQFVGPNNLSVEEQLVRPVARTVLRDLLNELRSEQYYDATARFAKAELARQACNHYLEPEGVTIDQVLLGEHKFNPAYEQVIKDKTVADQEAARLRSESEAAREQRRRELEVARGEVSMTIEQARGEATKRQLTADAAYFARQREAEAMLAEARAKAEGLKAQAKALSGTGGRNMVKLQVAEALRGKPIVFMPAGGGSDLRTTNMNALLEHFGALAVAGKDVPVP